MTNYTLSPIRTKVQNVERTKKNKEGFPTPQTVVPQKKRRVEFQAFRRRNLFLAEQKGKEKIISTELEKEKEQEKQQQRKRKRKSEKKTQISKKKKKNSSQEISIANNKDFDDAFLFDNDVHDIFIQEQEQEQQPQLQE